MERVAFGVGRRPGKTGGEIVPSTRSEGAAILLYAAPEADTVIGAISPPGFSAPNATPAFVSQA